MPRVTSFVHRILGLDPALRTLGFAVVEQRGSGLIPIRLGLIATKPSEGLSVSESYFASAQILYARLREIVVDTEGDLLVDEIRAEAFSYPPNAMSAVMIGNCWGVLAALSMEFGIPLKQASPQTIRKALHLPDRTARKPRRKKGEKPNPEQGRAKRTSKQKEQAKDDVLHAMEERFGKETIARFLAEAGVKRKADKRHPIDALAAAVAIR
jgi:Holliday junction resolvasome RuvABC endonuclease subunit